MIVLTLSFLFNDELACRLCVLRIIRENDLLDVVVEGEASTNAFEGYGVLTTGPGWRTADGHGFVFSIVGSSVLNCGMSVGCRLKTFGRRAGGDMVDG